MEKLINVLWEFQWTNTKSALYAAQVVDPFGVNTDISELKKEAFLLTITGVKQQDYIDENKTSEVLLEHNIIKNTIE